MSTVNKGKEDTLHGKSLENKNEEKISKPQPQESTTETPQTIPLVIEIANPSPENDTVFIEATGESQENKTVLTSEVNEITTPKVESKEDKVLSDAVLKILGTAYGENEPVYTKPTEKKANPFEKKQPIAAKQPSKNSRFSGMVNFSGEKGRIVSEIIDKGIEEGYWSTKQQFYDKVFDFAINSQLVHGHLKVSDAYIFGVPDSVETKLFANGYYENDSNLKLEICQ